MDPLATYLAYCCREWELLVFVRVGRCGYCGNRPKPKEEK